VSKSLIVILKPSYTDVGAGLTFIATDPDHERLGAASMLMRWGLERSKRSNIPIALESTPNADAFYRGFGFAAEAEISMQLDGVGPGGASVAYEEKCYVFRPSAQARSFDLVSERDGDQQESYK
jgi:ribosomal protein S18 acetylase RimI-like enzyme